MKYNYNIIIIGAGSGGLVVASVATSVGAKVALVEKHKMGGDCLNYGCVPSKSFLKIAHTAADIRSSAELGLACDLHPVDIKKIMARVKSVIAEIEPHDSIERYTQLGVDVLTGEGSLLDTHTVQIGSRKITAKYIVLATGSTAVIPPIPGLDTVPYFTNKNIFDIDYLPQHFIVLGGGSIGLELGQGFKYLGAQVTIIDSAPSLFMKDDDEVAPILTQKFKQDGMKLQLDSNIQSISKDTQGNISVTVKHGGVEKVITGDALLIGLGRKAVTAGLNLAAVGVAQNKNGSIQTNPKLQTTVKNIYACGDVTGQYQFTHMASYQAGIVIRNAIFKIASKIDYSHVPWVTYTMPEVAHVGYTEQAAIDKGVYAKSIMIDLDSIDRAKADNDRIGFLKLILNKKHTIIGATLVGNKAGEIIPIASLAIYKKLKPSVFMDLIFAYPTQAEIFKFAAFSDSKTSFKPWMKTLIKKLLLIKQS